MTIRANCKINIGLNIVRKREDGYHDLESIMFPVKGLFDTIEIEPSNNGTSFVQSGIVVDCPPERNLCMRACRIMQERYGAGDVAIHLDKRVPFGAGLGGGSSDATAIIIAMNSLFSLQLSEQELIDVASLLGSDTAFFVRNTPQLCSGRGEKMEPITIQLRDYSLVVAKPSCGVSTAEAYGGVTPHIPDWRLSDIANIRIEEWSDYVKNDFEPHVIAAHPEIGELKQLLLDAGAIYASMSGSGSAVFGLFKDNPDLSHLPNGTFIHTEKL